MAAKMGRRPKVTTRLPAALVRDLEWLQRYRAELLQHLSAQVRSVIVKETDPVLRKGGVRRQ